MAKISLSEQADLIIKSNPTLATMKPVIEKELVHYDIFFLLQQQNLLLPNMTFIGGTSLRLCHSSKRYSEDLDFHAGKNFKPTDFDKIRLELERYLSDRYGLSTEVKSPKQLRDDPDYSNRTANTWKVIIETHPQQRNLPKQRIHIDIANIPTHDVSPMLINTNYNNLPDGYNTILVNTSSKTEILADKLVAIPARNNIKARDFWDVIWLLQQNTPININLINQKIIDHGIINFKQLLSNKIEAIPLYFEKNLFQNEMSRFLDNERLSNTVNKPEFILFAQQKISQTLMEVFQGLFSRVTDKPEFIL